MVEERYEIRGKIGQGGVGAVYKAYDTQLRREVAIKRVLSDELDINNDAATNNLLQEATSLSSVQHPHICTVYDAGLDDEGPFVVMELIKGKTLDEMVERGTLTYEDFREVAIQSQEAMIAAQELKLVHRDLKPSNVMVSWLPSGRFQIKLVDFGLAKFSPKPSLQTIDHGDSVFGSIFFMAPEQFERVELDQRTDMYSLGAMFYFTLAGVYPFNGETAPQVMAAHLQNTVTPLSEVRPDLPQWLCNWVMWHIQRDVGHRPASAQDALERFLADESAAAQGMATTQPVMNVAPPILTAANLTPNTLSGATAPQPILSPNGRLSPATSPIAIQPAGGATQLVNTVQPQHNTVQPQHNQYAQNQLGQPQVVQNQLRNPQSHVNQAANDNKRNVIIVSTLLALAIIGFCIAIFGANRNKERDESYSKLIQGIEQKYNANESLPISKLELDYIHDTLIDPNVSANQKNGGYYALSIAESKDSSFSPSFETANFATSENNKVSDRVRSELFRTIAINPNKSLEAQTVLLNHAKNNPSGKDAINIVKMMRDTADYSDLNSLLHIFDNADEPALRAVCEITITAMIHRSIIKRSISNELNTRYNKVSADKQLKIAYLKILGSTGQKNSLSTLLKALKDDDLSIKLAASRGLAEFPTLEPFNAMLAEFTAEKSESNNKRLRSDIFKLLGSVENISTADKINHWFQLAIKAPTIYSQQTVVAKIGVYKEAWAKETLNKIITSRSFDTEVINLATKKLKEIK